MFIQELIQNITVLRKFSLSKIFYGTFLLNTIRLLRVIANGI